MNDPIGNTELEPDAPFVPNPAPLRSDDAPPSTGRWSVGTLTYTRAGLVVVFCLLLWGDFAWSMKERSAAPMLQILVKEVFHASNTEMQMFMVFIPNAIGILLGPIVSYKSDRHRGRWGRRIPFLMISTPFAVLAMIGLGFSPAMGHALYGHLHRGSVGLDRCIRLCFGFFWVIFEVATVAANSVFGGLINDVVPQRFIGRFYGMFRALSLIAGMAFNYSLLGLSKTHYLPIFMGIGLLYGLGFTFMCLTVKEGQYPEPSNPAEGQSTGVGRLVEAINVYLRECFSKPYYVWVMLALMLGSLAFMPVNNFSQPFATSLNISNDDYGKYLSATYFFSLLLSVYIGYLADRFHPLRTSIAAMLLYAVVTLWASFHSTGTSALFHLGMQMHPLGASSVRCPMISFHSGLPISTFAIALIAHGVLSGTYFTCAASLGQRLFPHSRFAQFFSAATVVIAVSSMLFAKFSGNYFDAHGPIYQRTYAMGFVLSVLGVLVMLIVHARFMALGGMKSYAAP